MKSLIIMPGIENLRDSLGYYGEGIEKLKLLMGDIGRRATDEAWVIYDPENEDCTNTAMDLTVFGRDNHILPVSLYKKELSIKEGRILGYIAPEKLKTIDDIIEKNRKSNGNSLILVTNPLVARVFPTHYWNKILRGRGRIKPLKSGEAIAFTFEGADLSSYASCEILPSYRKGKR